jgi:hypothetical protein
LVERAAYSALSDCVEFSATATARWSFSLSQLLAAAGRFYGNRRVDSLAAQNTLASGEGRLTEDKMRRVTIFLALILVLFAAGTLPTIRAGAQQAVVTDDNLDQMIASAKTPAEHDAIAAFYEQQATDAKKKAELHRNTAETYRKLKISKPVGMAEMCDGIAAMWAKIAADNSRLAEAHREMAKEAGA